MLQKIICQRTTLLRAQIFKRGHGKRQISSERFRLPMRGEAAQRRAVTAAFAFFIITGATAKLAIEPFAFRRMRLQEEQA